MTPEMIRKVALYFRFNQPKDLAIYLAYKSKKLRKKVSKLDVHLSSPFTIGFPLSSRRIYLLSNSLISLPLSQHTTNISPPFSSYYTLSHTTLSPHSN
jgi:hypothetical protein